MHKKYIFITTLFFFLSYYCIGQDNTSSPYSRYGLGELSDISGTQSRSLGGFSIGLRDPFNLNLSNPASISALDTTNSFGAPFIFEFGLQNKITELRSSNASNITNNTNLNYIAFAFPIIRDIWYSSVFLSPFSNVGYSIQLNEDIENVGNVDYYYHGSGGLNRFGFCNSVKFAKHFALGVNVNYLFGYLKQTNSLIYNDDSTDNFNYQIEYNTHIADLYYNFGLQYFHSIKNKNEKTHKFVLGIVFDNASNLKATRDIFSGTTLGGIIDNIDYNNIIDTSLYETGTTGTVGIPQNIGFGISYNYNQKITIGIDYSQQNWAETLTFGASDSLANSNNIGIGLEYIPNMMNNMKGFDNFLKRTRYRFGAYYSNTYLNFQQKGEQLSDFGISFGLGLPIRRGKSTLNIFVNLGQRGTTKNNLIKESYGIIGVNINLYDVWFVKRKYD